MDYSNEVQSILSNGYIQIDDFFTEEEFNQLFEHAKNVDEIKNADLVRNFSHPVYQLAVGKKIQVLLFGLAKARIKAESRINKSDDFICSENISISFARKGPTYNNPHRAKDAFHYDDSFVNAVLTFSLPENADGNGLFVYKNLKAKLGMGFIAKIVSRLLGRLSFLRYVFKPAFIPYKVGGLTLFFGDITLHGVGECYDGDRVSLTFNLSQVSLEEFNKKYQPHYLN
jgi:hypothetical protein